MSKRAIILAGGKGTRLRPYTITLPKPLVPIGDYPILEIILKQLKNYGFEHITLAVNHLAEIIQAFFGDGSKWGLKIDYSNEDKPLSTMGPLKLLQDLPENFLVMNGDVLTDLNYEELYQYHIDNNSLFTISSYTRNEKIDYGVLDINDNKLVNFREKPTYNFDVSMGIYIINRKVLNYIPENTFFGFDHLMLTLLNNMIYPLVKKHDGFWLDIGRPDDYATAIEKFNNNFI